MGNPEVEEPPPLPHSKKLKYLTTCAILFGNITFGSAFNFISPALTDIQNKYHSETNEIAVIFTVLLIGYCVGGLGSGFLYNFINRQLVISFLLGGMAFSLFIIPHLPSKILFFVAGGFLGICCGLYDSAQVVWVMEFWQSNAGPVIQAQHFFYALGSNIPPLLLGPFLSKDSGDDDEEDSTTSTTMSTSTSAEIPEESRIYIPFTIAGVLTALACSYQLFLFIFFRYYKPPFETDSNSIGSNSRKSSDLSEKDMGAIASVLETQNSKTDLTTDAGVEKAGINWEKIKLVILTAMFLGAYQGMEMCTMQFIPTFGQKSDLKLSESDSAFVLTGLTAAFAVGRFLGIFVILKIIPQFILVGNLVLIIAGNFIILFWADSDVNMLWAGGIIIGAGFSTMYPSFCAFIERHIIFTNEIGSFIVVVGSATAAIYPLIVGGAIDNNPVVLTYTNFFSIGACIFALGVSSFLTYGNKKRVG